MATKFQWSRISDRCWSCDVGHGPEKFHLEAIQLDRPIGNWRGQVSIGDSYAHQWFVLRECWKATDAQAKRRVEKDLLDVLELWSKMHEELKNDG